MFEEVAVGSRADGSGGTQDDVGSSSETRWSARSSLFLSVADDQSEGVEGVERQRKGNKQLRIDEARKVAGHGDRARERRSGRRRRGDGHAPHGPAGLGGDPPRGVYRASAA